MCINTVIGVAMALMLDQDDIRLERVGMHCLECFFRYMRLFLTSKQHIRYGN